MPIIKGKFQTQYVQVSNKTAQDKNLSFEARGLLVFMLSLPEDWVIHKSWLIEQTSAGRDKIQRMVNELVKMGYLVKKQAHGDNGQFLNNDLYVYPEPMTVDGLAVDGLAVDDKPTTTKETLLEKKDNTNTVQQVEQIAPLKTQECEEMAFDLIWGCWPVKQNKKKAKESFNKICKKLKTDEAIKNEVAMMLNYQQMALARLKATNGGEYIGFDKLHMTTFLNQQRYKDLSADEVLEILAGCE
jgi:hypothetical protein